VCVFCSNAFESSRANKERAKIASRYGPEDFEVVDMRGSVDLLSLLLVMGANDKEGDL
jgi:hypothetical protein